ncbi:MAG: hypothetical protein ABI467_08800 [Kofleriaceae bacterium]
MPSFAQAPGEAPLVDPMAVPAPVAVDPGPAIVRSGKDPSMSVTIEPIFLLAGIAEANVEVRIAPHVALQALGGYGGIVFAKIKELGGEVNVYVRPQITGLHFGAELKYLWGSDGIPFANTDHMDVTEREVGVYAGWKWVGWRGLSAVVQAGVARLDLSGGAPDSGVPKTQIIPAANATVGLSF